MSRFGMQCKRCRYFLENMETLEQQKGMLRQGIFCLARKDVFADGKCDSLLDVYKAMAVEEVEDLKEKVIQIGG